MINLIKIVATIGLVSISTLAYSAEITDTYNTGDTLTVETLNTIKNAVNDNDSQMNDRTIVLCELYQVLFDDGLIGSLSVPDFCPKAPPAPTYTIGDTGPAGGIVFYITDGGQHGLEAARSDQGTAVWGCTNDGLGEALNHGIGTGAQNTAAILANCPTPNIAARLADSYEINGFSDWFLPSILEYRELALRIGFIAAGLDNAGCYWSSTQSIVGESQADCMSFGDIIYGPSNKNNLYMVRAVRAF